MLTMLTRCGRLIFGATLEDEVVGPGEQRRMKPSAEPLFVHILTMELEYCSGSDARAY